MATKIAETAKLTALQKKGNAIVSAQASAIAAAIKTADDVTALAANPTKFAKAKGFEITTSFAKELKASFEGAELSEALQIQLSEAAASTLLGTVGKVVEGSDIVTDCAHIIVKKKRISWIPIQVVNPPLKRIPRNCAKTITNVRVANAKKIVK